MSRLKENKEMIDSLDAYSSSYAMEIVLRDISISLARICDALERIEEPKK